MQLALFILDAFAEHLFEGNPAAVMPMRTWLDDAVLGQLAAENRCSETAFYRPCAPPGRTAGPRVAYELRWFSPSVEVELCGHATLAAAGQLFDDVHPREREIAFSTASGWLVARRAGRRRVCLDLPSQLLQPVPVDPVVSAALGLEVLEAHLGADLVLIARDADAVRALSPDWRVLRRLPVRGVAVSAPSDEHGVDFVSRWFGAQAGIDEDPVTGSLHCALGPLWADRLGRARLFARQLSARGGSLALEVRDGRVQVTGGYVRYAAGVVTLSSAEVGT